MAQEPQDPARPDPDGTTLETLFARYHRSVVYFFLRAGVPNDAARDLAQTTFLRAHRGWSQFRGASTRSTWLYEIAKNVYKNSVRDGNALKNQGFEISLEAPTGESDDEPQPRVELIDPGPSADDLLELTENTETLNAAVAKLPPLQRQCVKLRLQDLKYQEIAAILGISIETVKSHLYQARETLRRALDGLL